MPRKPKFRIAELCEADALMRDIRMSDDAAEVQALLAFLRTHTRARVWVRSLIDEVHLPAWNEACRGIDGGTLKSLGVGSRVARELAERSQPGDQEKAFGGLSELQVLLLIRKFSGRQPRIGLPEFLVLRLWHGLAQNKPTRAVPLALAEATLELWRRTIETAGGSGLERLGQSFKLLDQPSNGKRAERSEWRLDVLRYLLANPKVHYTLAELHRSMPPENGPKERKEILNFCRANGISAGRRR